MIHYQLHCAAGHEFDGWFKDSAAFDQQAKHGLLECPSCGGTEVARALMAPAVPRKSNTRLAPAPAASAPAAEPSEPAAPPAIAGHLPDHVRAMLQRLRTEVEKSCDYVGGEFAEEARRIHRGETEPRGIYGQTSSDEAESLAEEGIEIAHIPWLPRADS
jgi:hypothetical protein